MLGKTTSGRGEGEERPRSEPSITTGKFYVKCNDCDYMSKPDLIEKVGMELEECLNKTGHKVFLE